MNQGEPCAVCGTETTYHQQTISGETHTRCRKHSPKGGRLGWALPTTHRNTPETKRDRWLVGGSVVALLLALGYELTIGSPSKPEYGEMPVSTKEIAEEETHLYEYLPFEVQIALALFVSLFVLCLVTAVLVDRNDLERLFNGE